MADNLLKIKEFLEKLVLDLNKNLLIYYTNIVAHHRIVEGYYSFRVTGLWMSYSYFTLKIFNNGDTRFRIGKFGDGRNWEYSLDFLSDNPEEEIIDLFPTLFNHLEYNYWETKRRVKLKPMTIVINRMKQFWEENR